jgi:hypothetical protein
VDADARGIPQCGPMSDEDDDWGANAPATVISPSFDELLEQRAGDLDALEMGDLQPLAPGAVEEEFGEPTRVAESPSFDDPMAPLEGRVTDPDPPPGAEPAESKFVAEQRELPSYLTQRRMESAPSAQPAANSSRARPSPVLLFLSSASVVFFTGACLLGIAFAILR